MTRSIATLILSMSCLLCPLALADVEVMALFKNAAYLKVNGKERLVKVGTSFEGVQLLEADSKQARILVNGREQTVTVSERISAVYQEATLRTVSIRTNKNRQYVTTATINGHATQVLVDTGANVVAMNSGTADALGLDYRNGVPHLVTTASGQVLAYSILLDSVVLGGIRVNQVQASVLEGRFPATVLLGMSYLEHVEMSEKAGVLMLLQRY
ncbi:MAG: TIGR02281 family clan AA aspartic protease [Gammaproteobacteria bacterium]|nr:TIGR02281 family clan AA aspartic protease [Gammaproteobacteria bacterium]